MEFERAVQGVGNADQLRDALEQVTRAMGFRYFALSHHLDFRRNDIAGIRLHNYPKGYEHWFDDRRLGISDPVHRASYKTHRSFQWARLGELILVTRADERILRRAQREGIGEGMTVPANVLGEARGSCSFAMRAGETLSHEIWPIVESVGLLAFECARNLCGKRAPDAFGKGLTDRQRDCLLWTSRGKTDWETSIILGISHDTVIDHVRQARRRYGGSSRALLTAQILYDGSLCFGDIFSRK